MNTHEITEQLRQYEMWKRAYLWEHKEMQSLHGDSFHWFLENRYRPVAPRRTRRPAPPQPQEPANGMSMNQAIQHDLYMCRNKGGAQAAEHNAALSQVHKPCPHCTMELHDPQNKSCSPPKCF